MRKAYCDICRRELVNPVPTRTTFHIKEFEVCESCKDVIESKLRPVLRNHFPYSEEWYEQQITSLIEKGISSGRP